MRYASYASSFLRPFLSVDNLWCDCHSPITVLFLICPFCSRMWLERKLELVNLELRGNSAFSVLSLLLCFSLVFSLQPCLRALRNCRMCSFISSMIQSISKLINLLKFTLGKEDPNPGWMLDHSLRTDFTKVKAFMHSSHALEQWSPPSHSNIAQCVLILSSIKCIHILASWRSSEKCPVLSFRDNLTDKLTSYWQLQLATVSSYSGDMLPTICLEWSYISRWPILTYCIFKMDCTFHQMLILIGCIWSEQAAPSDFMVLGSPQVYENIKMLILSCSLAS